MSQERMPPHIEALLSPSIYPHRVESVETSSDAYLLRVSGRRLRVQAEEAPSTLDS